MKKLLMTSLAALMVAGAANAADMKPYASLKVGYLNDTAEDADDALTGYVGAIAGGAAFSINPQFDVRAELEFAYGQTKKDEDVKLTSSNLMVNAYVDYKASKEMKPYVGVGVGYAMPAMEVLGTDMDLKGALIYGVAGGVAYQLNDQIAIDLGVKYNMSKLTPDVAGAPSLDLTSVSVLLGARYAF